MKKFFFFLLGALIGIVTGTALMEIEKIESERKIQARCNKFLNYYTMLTLWMKIKHQKRSLAEYFAKRNIESIAIYGMGEVGQRLCEELLENQITIKYAIDKNMNTPFYDIAIKKPNDTLESVDLVIVTATYEYDVIQKELENTFSCPIVSLNEIVFSLRD